MRIQVEEVIDAPSDQVFEFIAIQHFENHPKWDPSIQEMTATSPGPIRRGSTARFVRVDRKRRSEGVLTVTEYEPDRLFGAVSQFGPFELRQRAVCEPLPGEATRLVLTIDTRAAGAMGLLLPLFRRQFRATMTASLGTIKQHVESRRSR